MERTVMLCIFGNEEHGQQGSSAFAREARKRGKDFRAVINLDVLGYGRPRWPFYLDAVLDNNSYDQKLKMTWMMAKNYCRGVINGNNAIKVVGRPANARLVNLTSRELARISGIDVKGIVKKDCG
jgi:Zn-dependent M28 family amino/carboxypeptidase